MLVLRESQIIAFWTFWSSALVGFLFRLALGWPIMPVYLVTVLTVGPSLAILRGRDRSQDRLNVAERAVAEIIALIELILIGSLAARWVF